MKPVPSPTRVAFYINYDVRTWLGGLNYLRNLFTVVGDFFPGKIIPILITGRVVAPMVGELPWAEWHRTPMLDWGHPLWWARQLVFRTTGRDLLMNSLLHRLRVQVLSHSPHLGPGSSIPVVGWIPDFQYEHLPDLTPPDKILFLKRFHRELSRYARLIVVSSEATKQDLGQFIPEALEKGRVMHFVAVSMGCPNPTPISELERKYRFSGPFFHLPNQFWAHKNHGVVIQALSRIPSQSDRPLVLATGKTRDIRNPGYFDRLMEMARTSGVEAHFRSLGTVPFPDLVGMMSASRAVLNPSKFEGWSTSVEEAKFLGKPLILSDIPVHREQVPTGGRFFPQDSPDQLAQHLVETLRDGGEGPRFHRGELATRNREGAREFALKFVDIIQEALAK